MRNNKTAEYEKCPETGETTKSLEYGNTGLIKNAVWFTGGPKCYVIHATRQITFQMFRFSNLFLIFGHISKEFSFSSLMKGGPNSVTWVSQVAPLWMRRMMGKMTKARQVIRWRRQIINSGSKPRLPIDQINDCRTQHKCPDVPPSLLHWSTLCCVYFSVSCCTAVHQT